jgi:hypothetical protein
MYIVIAATLFLGILSVFGRRLEKDWRLRKLEAELHVLKHEMAHKNMELKKTLTKSSTVADDIEYTWEKYARKHFKKGWE